LERDCGGQKFPNSSRVTIRWGGGDGVKKKKKKATNVDLLLVKRERYEMPPNHKNGG